MADPPTGQKPPPKTIITEGDRKNNTINALSDIGLVTSQLTTTIAHLKEFVGAELERGVCVCEKCHFEADQIGWKGFWGDQYQSSLCCYTDRGTDNYQEARAEEEGRCQL